MIRPPGFRGAFFGDAADGNGRDDPRSRRRISMTLGISSRWASVHQVHGDVVLCVDQPGPAGTADGLITERPDLPLVIATADCMPIIVEGNTSVAILHAGWRGVAAGIIVAGLAAMIDLGDSPQRAAIGPSIGPCCYQVGDEVLAAIGGYGATTTDGRTSADLWSAAEDQLAGVPVWRSDQCTYTNTGVRSYRRDRTKNRQVAVAWVPRR
jgi:hypothetical protein